MGELAARHSVVYARCAAALRAAVAPAYEHYFYMIPGYVCRFRCWEGEGNAQNSAWSNHQSRPRTRPHTSSLELALDVRLELVGPLPGVLSPSFPSHMSSRSRS